MLQVGSLLVSLYPLFFLETIEVRIRATQLKEHWMQMVDNNTNKIPRSETEDTHHEHPRKKTRMDGVQTQLSEEVRSTFSIPHCLILLRAGILTDSSHLANSTQVYETQAERYPIASVHGLFQSPSSSCNNDNHHKAEAKGSRKREFFQGACQRRFTTCASPASIFQLSGTDVSALTCRGAIIIIIRRSAP